MPTAHPKSIPARLTPGQMRRRARKLAKRQEARNLAQAMAYAEHLEVPHGLDPDLTPRLLRRSWVSVLVGWLQSGVARVLSYARSRRGRQW